MFPTSLETEFQLERVARQAQQLDAADLRRVLVATWAAHAAEKAMLIAALETEGITLRSELRGLEPLELAQRLRPEPIL